MPRRPPRILPLGLSLAAATFVAAPGATAATLYTPSGSECRLTPLVPGVIAGQALTDPLGYVYDTGEVDVAYGTLDDGSTQLAQVGRYAFDAFDRFGGLFVGTGQSEATRYRDAAADDDGCTTEVSGRQLALKRVTRSSLEVQRRVFVSSRTGSGARLLDTVTNLTAAPLTTTVHVGDLRDDNGGSLGSDSTTQIAATSSGDTSITTADRWAVTTDGRTLGSDPAVAHVWGGAGADDGIDLVRSGAQPGAKAIDAPGEPLDADQLGWAWSGVTVAPGESRSFLSWETMRVALDGRASTQAGLAATAAAEALTAPLSRIYEGLTAGQIGSVANWAKPDVHASIAAPATITAGKDATFTATGVDFGSSAVSACTTGKLEWDFGDGATATGSTVTHRFATASTPEVALTVRGTCGGVHVTRTAAVVAAPEPKQDPEPAKEPVATDDPTPVGDTATPDDGLPDAPPATTPTTVKSASASTSTTATADREATDDDADREDEELAPATLELDVAPKLSARDLGKRGVRPTLVSSAPGTVRLIMSGGGLKIVKTKQVLPGVVTPAAMKLGPGDARRVKGLKTLTLRAKLTLATGEEVVVSKVVSVTR